MTRVVTFLMTQNPVAALAFYGDKMGFTFMRDDGFALVFDMRGIQLRIGKVQTFTPAEYTVLGWECEEIEADLDALTAKGVEFTRYPNIGQDERGICTFPNGARVAWFKDPDGNVLSLSEPAKN